MCIDLLECEMSVDPVFYMDDHALRPCNWYLVGAPEKPEVFAQGSLRMKIGVASNYIVKSRWGAA